MQKKMFPTKFFNSMNLNFTNITTNNNLIKLLIENYTHL